MEHLKAIIQEDHFKRLNEYFTKSKFGYDVLLYGAKHFGFYPKNKKISEKTAQNLMHDLIGEKLRLGKSMKVLDAGCGQGVVSTYLAKKFGCLIQGITVVPFEIETLCHSTDIRKTIKEFFRVLKRGGKVAFFEYNMASDKKFNEYELDIINKIIYFTASPSLKEFRPNRFEKILKDAGFKNVGTGDITENFKPSINRLRRIAVIPYYLLIKPFNLQNFISINLTIAVEFHKLSEKGFIRYKIFTGEK